eukprot:SAG11_NODE_74_length_18043_cov_13.387818_2_plen_99_part_00
MAPPRAAAPTPSYFAHALILQVQSFRTRVCSEGQVAITVVLHDIVYTTLSARPTSLAIKMHPGDAAMRVFGHKGESAMQVGSIESPASDRLSHQQAID